jgi:Fe-S cluster assembly scaffold protein SufB
VDIDVQLITTGQYSSCTIFGLFFSDAKHPVTGSLKVSLTHSQTSANIELISFLHDGAKVAIDGSIDIAEHLDQVHGRLLEQNIVLGKDISLRTLPKLTVASHNVTAAHGAKIDTLDQQKLFYMMSRGLTK